MEKQVERVLQLIQEDVFTPIDLYFAKTLLKEEPLDVQKNTLFLLCYLLACARQGHLCLQILPKSLHPFPGFLTPDVKKQEELTKEVLWGASQITPSLYEDVSFASPRHFLKPLGRYKDLFYLQKNFLLESKFLSQLKRIARGSLRLKAESPLILNAMLNEKQRKAVLLALDSPLCFISGGPGTGKTFTAAEIVRTFLSSLSEEEKKTVLIKIAAPTGKAAAHLEKKIAQDLDPSISVECATLHSLLQIKSKHSFQQKTATLFADLFLIDEASMLDAKLFSKLLESLQEGGRLVFMGDKNQLPPVEAGGFFADLIDIAENVGLPAITLEECLRVEKKELIDFASSIIQGDSHQVLSSRFVRIFPHSAIHQIRELIWNKCQLFFAQGKEEIDSFRILSCIRKGPLGVENLNEMILQRFLEGQEEDSFFSVPILITENSESMQLMNGDTGYLVAKVSSLKKKRFTQEDKAHFSTRSFSALLLPSFEWGYCLSVHKSQGSEYDSVIALAPLGSESFGREVLYTAITRAKKELLLLSEEATLISLLSRSCQKTSGLSQRLSFLGLEKGSMTAADHSTACVLGSAQ